MVVIHFSEFWQELGLFFDIVMVYEVQIMSRQMQTEYQRLCYVVVNKRINLSSLSTFFLAIL
tara:strand:- start:42894 stop:43079 length:186 start_codon:yes stop_codon:yes gene_type:complete